MSCGWATAMQLFIKTAENGTHRRKLSKAPFCEIQNSECEVKCLYMNSLPKSSPSASSHLPVEKVSPQLLAEPELWCASLVSLGVYFSLSRLHRCSIRGNLGLSCRTGTPTGCFLDVSFLPSCLACLEIFLCYCRCKPWSKSARSFRQCSRRGDLQTQPPATHRAACKSLACFRSRVETGA